MHCVLIRYGSSLKIPMFETDDGRTVTTIPLVSKFSGITEGAAEEIIQRNKEKFECHLLDEDYKKSLPSDFLPIFGFGQLITEKAAILLLIFGEHPKIIQILRDAYQRETSN